MDDRGHNCHFYLCGEREISEQNVVFRNESWSYIFRPRASFTQRLRLSLTSFWSVSACPQCTTIKCCGAIAGCFIGSYMSDVNKSGVLHVDTKRQATN